jgi:hypothetical protein
LIASWHSGVDVSCKSAQPRAAAFHRSSNDRLILCKVLRGTLPKHIAGLFVPKIFVYLCVPLWWGFGLKSAFIRVHSRLNPEL